jgi:hypothetical protein
MPLLVVHRLTSLGTWSRGRQPSIVATIAHGMSRSFLESMCLVSDQGNDHAAAAQYLDDGWIDEKHTCTDRRKT